MLTFIISGSIVVAIVFVILIVFFRRIITQNVTLATKHIDELNQEYDRKDKEVQKRLEEAKTTAQEIVTKAADEARMKKDEALDKVVKEKENILKQARSQSEAIMQQADKSREQIILELDQRIAKEAIKKASELIQYALPEDIKIAAHAQWVKDLIENGFDKIGRVKISEGVKEAKVVSAFALDQGDRSKLLKKINGLLGSEAELKEEVDPKIVAGIVVEIGSVVLDGSLGNRILEQASALDAAQRGDDGE